MNPTPLSLLERLRDDPDEVSWSRLSALYEPLVRRWLGRHNLDPSDIDDLTQEVMLVLFRELPRFEHSGRPGAFRAWVKGITINRLKGYWRTRRNGQPQADHELEKLADPQNALNRLWDQEHDTFIARRLMDLIAPEFAPSTWNAFRRQVLDGLKPAEVADEMGVSVNAVLISKSRVLRRLRQEGRGILD